MKATVAVAILGALALAGCGPSQDTNINFNPTITACPDEGLGGAGGDQNMTFEILLDTRVDSKRDATNAPDISPTLTIPLP